MTLQGSWQSVRPYLIAVLAVAVALLARLALDPWLEDRQAFLTFMFAVVFTVWVAGVGPSLVALVAGLPLAAWFFLPPRYNFQVVGLVHQIGVSGYLVIGLTVVALGGRLWRAKAQAMRTEEHCDSQVRELDSERKRLQEELARMGDELRDVDRRREDFLALLADELRRPLVPIASAASFHSIAATASEMESAMDVVKQETARLGRLIDDLLDAFRNGQKGIEIRRERLDLAEVASRAVTAVRSLAAQTGRELTVSLAKDPAWVEGDEVRLERVAYNLLMNAIRSTSPGGQIWLTAQGRDEACILKVRDTGVGLSPDAIQRIFQIDNRSQGSRCREHGGVGIGLSAVKAIVEIHGGAVDVFSDGPGQGCEIVVRLPRMAATPDQNAVPGTEIRKQ
jgi:signal transduction histidine kinase